MGWWFLDSFYFLDFEWFVKRLWMAAEKALYKLLNVIISSSIYCRIRREKSILYQFKHWSTRNNSAVWPISFPESAYPCQAERPVPLDKGNARTLGTRLRYGQYLTHAHNYSPDEPHIRAKQLSMAATNRGIWLCACVRYWPYHGVGTCASVLGLVLFQNTFSRP